MKEQQKKVAELEKQIKEGGEGGGEGGRLGGAVAAQLAESEKKRLDLEQRTKAWQEQTTRQFELAKQQNGALKGQVRSENRSDEPPYNSSLHGSKTS